MAFFIYEICTNKLTTLYKVAVVKYDKVYKIAGILFIGYIIYISLTSSSSSKMQYLLKNVNNTMQYVPIDKSYKSMWGNVFNIGNTLFPPMSASQNSIVNPVKSVRTPLFPNSTLVPTPTPPIIPKMSGNSGNNTKRSVSETKKKIVASKQQWQCGDCKNTLNAWFEVDHKHSLQFGGTNDIDNLIALCRECHGKKTAYERI